MIPARPTLLRNALRPVGLLAGLAALTAGGCYFSDAGLSPPTRAFYYPTGLAVSPGQTALYVASSDFDLQYNGGTVNVLDLRVARKALGDMLTRLRCAQQAPDACAAIGVDLAAAPSVAEVCAGFTYRQGAGIGVGKACISGADCASGVCEDALCRACTGDVDCAPLGGTCGKGEHAGACVLAKNGNSYLTPSACSPLAPPFAGDGSLYATIGAFASGVALAVNPDGPGARLFVPVRGDPSITWFDVLDDRTQTREPDISWLDCRQSTGGDQRCGDSHRMGLDAYDNPRLALLPVEPVGLDVSEELTGDADTNDNSTVNRRYQPVVSAHQVADSPSVSLSVNRWGHCPAQSGDTEAGCPTLEYYVSGVPSGPAEVAHVPAPRIVKLSKKKALPGITVPMSYEPGFLVSYNDAAELDLYRYQADELASPPRPFITRAASVGINVNADGKDSRGLAVDDSRRKACEVDCAASDIDCLRLCVDVPLDVYMANRSPASLIIGRVRTTLVDGLDAGGNYTPLRAAFDQPEIYDSIPLTTGPSKVVLGKVIGADGKLHTRVFTVTFESRQIFSYDPEARRIDAVIDTGRGPHAIAFDTGDDGTGLHSYLYVGHFTDSYLGVVDLDMRHPETFGIMFASIGVPVAPRESK